jgi:WG containing repeat
MIREIQSGIKLKIMKYSKNLILTFFALCLLSTLYGQQSDYKNKIIKLQRQYDWVFNSYEAAIIPVKKNNKTGYVRMSNLTEILPCALDLSDPRPFSEGMAINYDTFKGAGFIDTTGKLVIPYQFKYATNFKEGVCLVSTSDEKNYFIDKKGNKLFQVNSGQYEIFENGIFLDAINLGNYTYEYQYLDKTGKPMIPVKYKNAARFENGLACVSVDGENFGYINRQGKNVIPNLYRNCSSYENKRPLVLFKKNSDKPYYYDTDGTLLNQDSTIEYLYLFKDDYFGLKKQNGKFGIMHRNQKYLVEPTLNFLYKSDFFYCADNSIFDFLHKKILDIPSEWHVNPIYGALTLERKSNNKNLKAFITQDGKLSKNTYLSIEKIYSNDVLVAQDTFNKFGMIGVDESILLAFEYDKITKSREIDPNHYLVKKDKKQGVIDIQGKVIIPAIYDTLFYNQTNYRTKAYDAFIVKKTDLWGVIDIFGNTVVPVAYEYLSNNLLGLAQKNGKLGMIDKLANVVIPFEYDNIDIAEAADWLNLEKDGHYGLANTQNLRMVVPAIFDYCQFKSDEIRNVAIGYLGKQKQVFSYQGKQLTPLLDNITVLPPTGNFYTGYMLEKDKKFGIVENNFDVILPIEFDKIDIIKNKFYIATKNGKTYFYQKNGKALYQGDIDAILNSNEEALLIVKSKNKIGLLEIEELTGIGENEIYELTDATLRLQCDYDDIKKIKEVPSFYTIVKGKKIGIYSKYEKRIVIPAEYDSIESIDAQAKIVLQKAGTTETYLLLNNGKVSQQN